MSKEASEYDKDKFSYKKVKKYLKDKKILFAHWDCENRYDYSYQNWYFPLKEIFQKVIFFSPKKYYFNYGKEKMNEMFLELVKKEKPDYIFFLLIYDEFKLDTFEKIRLISPKTKTINLFTDDSWRFDDFARYYAMFFDYSMSTYHKIIPEYKKEDIKNIFFSCGVNQKNFKRIKTPKKYDVTLIGRPNYDRVDMIRFLLKNKIKVNLCGNGWEKYPEFKDFYRGSLSTKDLVKVINQSKINLSFTKDVYGKLQLKGRPFEVSACGSFVLVEYFSEYLDFFKNKKEIIMFKDKKDMVEKIQYYLKNEKERESIAKAAHNKVVKKYNVETDLNKLFLEILKYSTEKTSKNFNKSNKKIIYLSEKDFDKKNIKMKLKNYDFICFRNQGTKISSYKDQIQAHSLKKSGKNISCCDYYVYSKYLGNYLLFKANLAFEKLNKDSFDKLLNISQIMVSSDYFLKNFKKFKEAKTLKKFTLIKKNNTVFVSIPLVGINKFNVVKYCYMKKAFQMKFLDRLYSLKYQKKLFFTTYPYKLFIESFKKKMFILKVLLNNLTDKDNLDKIKRGPLNSAP
jgi:glycosyltransferase involved in cell wall biosynthesis